MNWKFIKIATVAILLLAAAIVTLAQSQTVKVRIDKAEYQFPDSDACIYFDWEAIGVLDHTLQLTLRAVQHGTGDFIVRSGNDSAVVDSTGLLMRRLDVTVPFEHTEWDDTYLCLPAGQFPGSDYDWYPVLTVIDLDSGDLLLVRHFSSPIRYGQGAFETQPTRAA